HASGGPLAAGVVAARPGRLARSAGVASPVRSRRVPGAGNRLGGETPRRRRGTGLGPVRGAAFAGGGSGAVVLPRQTADADAVDVHIPGLADRLRGVVAVAVSPDGAAADRGAGRGARTARPGAAGRLAVLRRNAGADARGVQRVFLPLLVRCRPLPVPGQCR